MGVGTVTPVPTVEVATTSLLRAWKKADHEQLWLQFTAHGGALDVDGLVLGAINGANSSTQAAGFGEEVDVEGGWHFGKGVVACMSRCATPEAITAWLQAFAAQLEIAGLSGKVTAAPYKEYPRWVDRRPPWPLQLTTFVSYKRLDPAAPVWPPSWNVDAGLSAHLAAKAVSWGAFPGAQTLLRSGAIQVETGPDVSQALSVAMRRSGSSAVTYLRPDPLRVASAAFDRGHANWMVWDDQQTWQQRLQQAIEVMVSFPADTDRAFIQYALHLASGMSDFAYGSPALPALQERHFRYYPHLDAEFVPDARGALLLTDAHIRRAHDLSGWSVEALGHGRHLVLSRDLAAWFAQPAPDPGVLERARQDFGPVIMTLADLQANPPPWEGGPRF